MQADWRNDNHTKSQTTLRLHRCIATALDWICTSTRYVNNNI
jgi:hypothetical protein